jgi:hypothetical protein
MRFEYRVCRELAGMRADGLHEWWCDGFVPETLDEVRGVFSGRVWMARAGREETGHEACGLGEDQSSIS